MKFNLSADLTREPAAVHPVVLVSSQIVWLVTVLAALTVKHFLADFVFQTNWMARGKERLHGWFGPLMAHVGVHAACTLIVVLAIRPGLWWLAPCDFVIHALIDRSKAIVSHATQWPLSDERFWWLMGFDQSLHQLTNVAAFAVLISA